MTAENRNTRPLNNEEIKLCVNIWRNLDNGRKLAKIDTRRAKNANSETVFVPSTRTVILGANVFPHPNGTNPLQRLSVKACLAHEFAHADRQRLGINRPMKLPEYLIEESEASLHASFYGDLTNIDIDELRSLAFERLRQYHEAARKDRIAEDQKKQQFALFHKKASKSTGKKK